MPGIGKQFIDMISIVIADSHPVLRQGLRTVFEHESDFILLGETSDGDEAIRLVRELTPDVIVLDIAISYTNSLEIIEQIRKEQPETRIVVFTTHSEEVYLIRALKNGADCYVLQTESASTIIRVIRDAMQGKRYLSPLLVEYAINAYLKSTNMQLQSENPLNKLTPKEWKVTRLVAEGHTNTSIASQMKISSRTVETHRSNLMRKLDITCQADLVRLAVSYGLLDS
jgi:DNA-binding NarL/FixJ family response regulator